MKSVKGLSILVIALLLQGCLPDSFTKFKEEPAVSAEGASGDTSDQCPPGSENTDPFCAEPVRVAYSPSSLELDINDDEDNTDEDLDPVDLEPIVVGVNNLQGFNEYTTYTITPALPASTGLFFDIETGIITGKPQSFYPATTHTISAEYTGNTPVSLTDPGEVGTLNVSIATDLNPNLTLENPLDKTLVLNLDDAQPFLGRTWASAEGENGAAQILFVDETANQLHLDSNNVGTDGRFILRTQNILGIDSKDSFTAAKATSSGAVIAMLPGESLTVDDGALSTAIFTTPLGQATDISQEELETITYNITPGVSGGLIFTEETTCYDLTNPATPLVAPRSSCDLGLVDHQLVLGGTIWGEINPTAELLPTEYTITAANNHGSQAQRTIQLSILSPEAPKSIASSFYRQKVGQRLKISVDDASSFTAGGFVVNSEGKKAEVKFADPETNILYVDVLDEVDLLFKNGDTLDNRENFFAAETTINDAPTFVYNDDPINNQASDQLFHTIALGPSDIFEVSGGSYSAVERRSLVFSISPDVELLGSQAAHPGDGLYFQQESKCFEYTIITDTSTYSEDADFDDCDNSVANHLEIPGGTLWGQFDPEQLPLAETEFTVTAQTLTGAETSAVFKLEAAPKTEDAEMSYSQDMLLVMQGDVEERFNVGDYVSNIIDSQGTVKEVFTDTISGNVKTFLWVNIIDGTFSAGERLDNNQVYQKQMGVIETAHPINAKLSTSVDLSAAVNDIVNDDDNEDNIVLNTTSPGRARIVYANSSALYVRITEGSFSTGDGLEKLNLDETTTALAGSLSNINAQNLTLTVAALTPPLPDPDSSLVYTSSGITGNDGNSYEFDGDSYEGVVEVRKVNSSTSLDVEVIKGHLGLGADILALENPFNSSSDATDITAIQTNHNRYTFYKGLPAHILPTFEPNSSAQNFTINPPLPEGLVLDETTGLISGTPVDRSDLVEYTVTVSNEFDNQFYIPKTTTFFMEVNDYIGLFNVTQDSKSYILHKTGMGNGRSPCMITREQFDSASSEGRDITCFLDAGEVELFGNGIDLDLRFGKDLCQTVKAEPFFYSRFEAIPTNSLGDLSLASNQIHIGDVGVLACGGSASRQGVDPQSFCASDYDFNFGDTGYNCDEGTFDYREVSYRSFESCDCNGAANCSAGGDDFSEDSCGGCVEDGSIESRSACEEATFTWDAGVAQNDCEVSTQDIEHLCDGSASACLEGSGAGTIASKDELFNNGGARYNVQSVENLLIQLTSPADKNFESNRDIANFLNYDVASCSPINNYELDYNAFAFAFEDRRAAAYDADYGQSQITEPFTGSAFYTFKCEDSGGIAQARIRVMVREWNQGFRASHKIDQMNPDNRFSDNAEIRMDIKGTGLTADDGSSINFGNQANEHIDWENVGLTDGGSCASINASNWPDDFSDATSDCDAAGDCPL